MKTKVILISGKMGSGKDSLKDELRKFLERKDGVRVFTPFFAETIYQIHDEARMAMADAGIAHPVSVADKDRAFLQYLGTDWGRKTYGDDIWVKVLKGKIKELTSSYNGLYDTIYFIVSDCRFENEFDGFPEAFKIRLDCADAVRKERRRRTAQFTDEQWDKAQLHESETSLDQYAKNRRFDSYFNTEFSSPQEMVNILLDCGVVS